MTPRNASSVPGSVAGGYKSLRGGGRCCQQDKRLHHWRGEPSGNVQPDASPAPYGVGRGRDASAFLPHPETWSKDFKQFGRRFLPMTEVRGFRARPW